MFLLDTSAIIEILEGAEKGRLIKEIVGNEPLATTALTIHEIVLWEEGASLEKALDFIHTTEILNYDFDSAMMSANIEKDLKKKGKMINKIDILIGGIAKQHGLPIVVLDKDFENIPGIKVIVV